MYLNSESIMTKSPKKDFGLLWNISEKNAKVVSKTTLRAISFYNKDAYNKHDRCSYLHGKHNRVFEHDTRVQFYKRLF